MDKRLTCHPPSGYIPYTTTFPGINTPCYTTPILPLIPPGATANAAVSVIRTQLFALQYTVVPRKGSSSSAASLGTGPIAGIAVGAFFFLALLLGGGVVLIRRKRRQRDLEREATKSRPVSDVEQVPSPTLRGFGIHTSGAGEAGSKKSLALRGVGGGIGAGPAELDSPVVWGEGASPREGITRVWSELGANEKVSTPQEMEGDTFLHAHHPALGAGGIGNEEHGEGDDAAGAAAVGVATTSEGVRRESGNDTFKQAGTGSPRSPPFDAAAFSGSALGGMVAEEGEERKDHGLESPVLGKGS